MCVFAGQSGKSRETRLSRATGTSTSNSSSSCNKTVFSGLWHSYLNSVSIRASVYQYIYIYVALLYFILNLLKNEDGIDLLIDGIEWTSSHNMTTWSCVTQSVRRLSILCLFSPSETNPILIGLQSLEYEKTSNNKEWADALLSCTWQSGGHCISSFEQLLNGLSLTT